MRRYTPFILTILSLILTAACTARLDLPVPPQETVDEGIVLTLFCQDPQEATKAAVDSSGITAWNENRILTVDLYFYPEGGTSSNALLHYRYTGDKEATVTIPVDVTDADIDAICPRPNQTFQVYAIANYPDLATLDALTNTSIDNLKTLAISTDFVTNHKQNSFIMDGQSTVTLKSRTKKVVAEGEVSLQRYAAKISVQISVPDIIEVTSIRRIGDETVTYTEHWVPATDEMKVYIENGVKNTTLAGVPVSNPTYFNYRGNMLSFSKSSNPLFASFPWVTDPMYTYPQGWEYASQTSPTIEPDVKLLLPWTRVEESVVGSDGVTYQVASVKKQFYYKIMVPDDDRGDDFLKHFVRNNWYKFKVNVGILGSETDEASVEVSGDYYVVVWQDKDVVIKHAEIGLARFLSVDQTSVTLNNEVNLSLSFTSSHPVALKNITVTKPFFGSGTSYNDGISTITVSGGLVSYNEAARKARNSGEYPAGTSWSGQDWLKVSGSHILFHHPLNNDMSSKAFDTSPYTISFTVIHKDMQNEASTPYQQRVTITQMPAIQIKSSRNNDTNNNQGGYVKINGGTSAYGGATGNLTGTLGSGTNNNPNMYVISTSVLSSSSSFVIGDPRSTEVNNNLGSADNTWSTSATSVQGTSRRLSWYHPASSDDYAQYMISPSFRVASSYGKTYELSYNDAQKRCASYQESGYPAGRWRLPTRAEIEYMITLSQNQLIPSLFTPGANLSAGGYWCSTGVVYPMDDNSVQYYPTEEAITYRSTNWPRCVYDEWFWGSNQVTLNTFTWGDMNY